MIVDVHQQDTRRRSPHRDDAAQAPAAARAGVSRSRERDTEPRDRPLADLWPW